MATRRRQRVRRSQAQWSGIFQRFERSGLSAGAFCRREGLALSSFQRRRAVMGEASGRSEFIELEPPPGGEPAATRWAVELCLPGGVRLRLRV